MQETVTLFSPGAIPGIPGDHAPGTYLIDWDTRTATLVVPTQPEPAEAQTLEEMPSGE